MSGMSSQVSGLKLDFCTFEAAKYAVEHWHYSKSMPAGKLVKIGVWEHNIFKGCVLFGRGANNNLCKSFKLKQTECIELVRIALSKHETPVSRIVSIALKLLCKQSPGIKLIVSYADTAQGHVGGIYKASNWIYTGESHSESRIDPETGKKVHARSLFSKLGSVKGIPKVSNAVKHRYLYPLDAVIRETVLKLRKEYPTSVSSVAVAQEASSLQEAVQI